MRHSIVLACTAALLAQAPPSATDRVAAEISRVRADVASVVPESGRPAVTARLDRARAAAEAGRAYLALYELEAPWEIAAGWTFAGGAKDVTTAAAFEAKWKAAGEPAPDARATGQARPAFVEAIAAAAAARGPATYRASLPYSADSGIESGLYYLGESEAVGRFAALARAWPWPSAGTPLGLRSIAPEIDAFDREVTKAYEGMAREDHPAYILTSVTIKQARTLDAGRHYDGALLEYLLARLRFGAISKATVEDATASRIEAARARIADGRDHSIAEFFLQMAGASALSDDPALRRNAAIVLADVLPAYAAAIAAPPRMTETANGPAAVTITLVRWPFT